MTSSKPIFITGADRSGTSLMYALLASHPHISMVRRTNMWRWFYEQYGDLSDPDNFERCLDAMLRTYRLDALQPDPHRIRREFKEGDPSYGRLFDLFHSHYAQSRGKARWGDKSLHTEHYAEQIIRDFPGARIIHMIRDPRDRYASVVKRYQDRGKGIAATTGRWLASTRQAQQMDRRFPHNVMLLRYETLAQQPEATLRAVCDFIGEPYAPEMLSMRGAPEHGETGGNSSFTRFEPGVISTRSIGRYRKVLAGEEIAFIQLCARGGMRHFQYTPDALPFSRAERAHFYTKFLPTNLLRLAGWLALDRYQMRRGIPVPDSRLRPAADGAIEEGTASYDALAKLD